MKKLKCSKCLKYKPPSYFYKNEKYRRGYTGHCKDCRKIYSKAYGIRWRAENKERIRLWNKAHVKENYKAVVRDRKKNPQGYKARGIAGRAIRKGVLQRRPCVVCHSTQVDAHHEDYSKPLEVIWLCRAHHKKYHFGLVTLKKRSLEII